MDGRKEGEVYLMEGRQEGEVLFNERKTGRRGFI